MSTGNLGVGGGACRGPFYREKEAPFRRKRLQIAGESAGKPASKQPENSRNSEKPDLSAGPQRGGQNVGA